MKAEKTVAKSEEKATQRSAIRVTTANNANMAEMISNALSEAFGGNAFEVRKHSRSIFWDVVLVVPAGASGAQQTDVESMQTYANGFSAGYKHGEELINRSSPPVHPIYPPKYPKWQHALRVGGRYA